MARQHERLRVWRAGMTLVKKTYELTRKMPSAELYGLTSQMRRAAVSIPANIAEGYGRGSDAELRRFLLIARGSLFELETLLVIADSEGYARRDHIQPNIDKVFALLSALLSIVEKSLNDSASGVKRQASSA